MTSRARIVAALLGPSLAGLAARPYVAGRFRTTRPASSRGFAVRALDPQTVMPDLAVSEADARDIAAFLSTAR
jgi:hypothetical protein